MTLADCSFLAARRQQLKRELAHRLQHGETRLPTRAGVLPQQALLQERGDTLQRVEPGFACSAGDSLRRFQGEATDKDRQAPEEPLLLGSQQVVTPGDGGPHRLLPLRDITSTSSQQR